MSGNTYGKLFTVTTAGESHGPALVAIVDGCPPGVEISLEDLQRDLDRRKPGTSRHTTQRQEADEVEILSGVFEGKTTGCAIGLLIRNTDQKSKEMCIRDRRDDRADHRALPPAHRRVRAPATDTETLKRSCKLQASSCKPRAWLGAFYLVMSDAALIAGSGQRQTVGRVQPASFAMAGCTRPTRQPIPSETSNGYPIFCFLVA